MKATAPNEVNLAKFIARSEKTRYLEHEHSMAGCGEPRDYIAVPSRFVAAHAMSKRTTISLIGAVVAIACALVLASSRSAEGDGLPKGELSLPHFWVMSIGGGDFGIREWRYAGDDQGRGRMSCTTIFIGTREVSSRLPARVIVALTAAGAVGLGFTVMGQLGSKA